MKKEMITKETYMPLAEKIWALISAQYPNQPTPTDFGVMLGALEAVKFGINETMKKEGHSFEVLTMHDQEQ